MNLSAVEADVAGLTTDVEAIRRQIWLVQQNIGQRDPQMANINYQEFERMLRELRTKMDRIRRKQEDFEANSSS